MIIDFKNYNQNELDDFFDSYVFDPYDDYLNSKKNDFSYLDKDLDDKIDNYIINGID